jgi:hypothetical protein
LAQIYLKDKPNQVSNSSKGINGLRLVLKNKKMQPKIAEVLTNGFKLIRLYLPIAGSAWSQHISTSIILNYPCYQAISQHNFVL